MEIRHGIPVSPGVAIGPAFVLDAERYRIPDRFIQPGAYPDEIDERIASNKDVAEREEQLWAAQQSLLRRPKT